MGLVDSESDTEDSPPAVAMPDDDESDSEPLSAPGAMARFARDCRASGMTTAATDGSREVPPPTEETGKDETRESDQDLLDHETLSDLDVLFGTGVSSAIAKDFNLPATAYSI